MRFFPRNTLELLDGVVESIESAARFGDALPFGEEGGELLMIHRFDLLPPAGEGTALDELARTVARARSGFTG